MAEASLASDLERRKQVRLRLRTDLVIAPHKYEGKTFWIVKDPVSLRYYRFKEQEHFLLEMMDGEHTLEEAQKEFERRFRPDRLPLEDLEGFAQQLLQVGLAHNESPQAGKQLFDRRKKRLRKEWIATFTNILYIKIPVIDPDRILDRMLPWTRFIFTRWFFTLSVLWMLAALLLVATHFSTFQDKLPSYHEFFSFKTAIYLWIALGVVKVIHEFGHGLSCKTFGGEVHEMGALFLCLSPCLYCNVSDAWTLPNKWHRIIISFAGIYVELLIAAIATFVWWNTPAQPFINNLSLSLMVVCSVSTVVFNGNPLMRFDGYYVLADWLEIPNLRDRSNRFLKNLVLEKCLGVEVQPEPYMALSRKILFVSYAVASYIYRWVVTFSILYFLYTFLRPYKLGAVSAAMALAAVGSMIGWPMYRLGKALHKRGRLPDMKAKRVRLSIAVVVVVLLLFFLLPLPVSRVRERAIVQLQPEAVEKVFPKLPGILEELHVTYGQRVQKGDVLARFRSLELEGQKAEKQAELESKRVQIAALENQLSQIADLQDKARVAAALALARGELAQLIKQLDLLAQHEKDLELRAPRDGVVLSPPHKDEVGKLWDKEEGMPFCSIGEPERIWALVPVSPADYRLIREDWLARRREGGDLAVTIRVQGQADRTWSGYVAELPAQEAVEVPLELTTRAGGPLAIKPSSPPDHYVPQAQVYLVAVGFDKPDHSICPGTMAHVKVHCRWQTCAWWVWRTISNTFDLGLI